MPVIAMEIRAAGGPGVADTSAAMAVSAAWGRTANSSCSGAAEPQGAPSPAQIPGHVLFIFKIVLFKLAILISNDILARPCRATMECPQSLLSCICHSVSCNLQKGPGCPTGTPFSKGWPQSRAS